MLRTDHGLSRESPVLPRPPLCSSNSCLTPSQDLSSQCPKEEPLTPPRANVYLCLLDTRHGSRSLKHIISFKPQNNVVETEAQSVAAAAKGLTADQYRARLAGWLLSSHLYLMSEKINRVLRVMGEPTSFQEWGPSSWILPHTAPCSEGCRGQARLSGSNNDDDGGLDTNS